MKYLLQHYTEQKEGQKTNIKGEQSMEKVQIEKIYDCSEN